MVLRKCMACKKEVDGEEEDAIKLMIGARPRLVCVNCASLIEAAGQVARYNARILEYKAIIENTQKKN